MDSEAEVPVLEQGAQRPVEPGLVAEPAESEGPRTRIRPPRDPMGAEFDYAAEFKTLDLEAREEGHRAGDDDVAGLVAGRLRPLRPALHPHGVAQRGHLPHQRRPRRRRLRRAALRAAQQLARQREPRQGAPAALAGQEEVRPEDLVGRPDGASPATAPSSRWASRRSASAADARTSGSPTEINWGTEDDVARRRALQRRPGARQSRSPPSRWASST